MWHCEKWDRYLMGQQFTLTTDHKLLVTLFQSSKGIASRPLRLARWSARLLRWYKFRVIYRSSSQSVVGGALSRLPVSDPKSSKPINDEAAISSIV